MTVMIVDDEKGIRDLFVDVLTRSGYEVVACPNGASALERLTQQDVRAVFLDIKMSGLNGVAVLDQIKQLYPQLNVVMITGYASTDLVERANELKPFAVLNKPFGVRDILNVARSALATGSA